MKKGLHGKHYKADRKIQSFTLRLTDAEMDMIRTKAFLSGTTMAEFIISACAGKRVQGYKKPDLSGDNEDQESIDDFDFFARFE